MSKLMGWLMECIAADEAAARAADWGEPWSGLRLGFISVERDKVEVNGAINTHIARWDPARVLAECAARRAVLDLWERADRVRAECAEASDRARLMDDVLRGVALAYADRPVRDPAWPVD